MAKTVDNFATIEDFRKQYNELAYDVGDINGLNGSMKLGSNDTVVDALNVLASVSALSSSACLTHALLT